MVLRTDAGLVYEGGRRCFWNEQLGQSREPGVVLLENR